MKVLGDERLSTIGRVLVETARTIVTIDWVLKESVRAKLRVMVKTVFQNYGYPGDKQEKATQTVLEQTELLGRDCAQEPAPVQEAHPERRRVVAAPFRHATPHKEDSGRTCHPLATLRAAAGGFGNVQDAQPVGRVQIKTSRWLRPGMFVAQGVGRSIDPRISAAAWSCWQAAIARSRQGRTVLAQHRDKHHRESGGGYTVKRYQSRKENDDGDGSRPADIRVLPENLNFAPIILRELCDDEFHAITEGIEVLA